MSAKNLRDYVYVCPYCINQLKECSCDAYPMKLVQLDRKIWPVIKVLNEKWYITENCCEGHIGGNPRMYILFDRKYRFQVPLPKGFSGDGNCLYAEITGSSAQAKQRKKRQLLNALYHWACALESHRPEGAFLMLKDF